MRLGRESDLDVGNRTFRIVTNLKAGDVPVIETLVLLQNKTVHHEEAEISDLRPVFKHGQEIAERVEEQHLSVRERLQHGEIGGLGPAAQPTSTSWDPESLLDQALAQLAAGDAEEAEVSFRRILERDPNFTEARELIEATTKIKSGELGRTNPDVAFKAGAEAFASGQTRQAIEHWKDCLAADSSSRSYQLVLLLSTSVSAQRRKIWLQELLAMGSRLLAEGRSSEAYSLLLVAQSAEQPTTETGAPPVQAPDVEVQTTEPASSNEDWGISEPTETTAEEIVNVPTESLPPQPTPSEALDIDFNLEETILEIAPQSLPAAETEATPSDEPAKPPAPEPQPEIPPGEFEEGTDTTWIDAGETEVGAPPPVPDPVLESAVLPEAPLPEPKTGKLPEVTVTTTPTNDEKPTAAAHSRELDEDKQAAMTDTGQTDVGATPPVPDPVLESAVLPEVPSPEPKPEQPPEVTVTTTPTNDEKPMAAAHSRELDEDKQAAMTDTGQTDVGATPPKGDPVRETQSSTTRTIRPRPKPRPPSLFESSKWLIVGGGAFVVLLGVVVVAFFFLGGGSSLPTEELEQAERFLSSGNNSEAVRAYNQILSTHGDIAPAFLGRGRAQLAAGNIDLGLTDLKKAVELDPEDPAITEELADVLYTRGRFNEAIGYYQQALSGKDISAEALYRLGASLIQLNRSDEAMNHLDSALKKDPAHAEARLLYGRLLNRAARYADAEEVLNGGGNTPSEAARDYRLELAVSLLEQGKLETAEEVTRQLLNDDTQDSRALTLLGEIYLKRKQYEAARRELIRALRLNPQEARAQLALGRTWLAIGKTRGDRNDLTKARQILANARGVHDGERLLTLGQISMAEGDTETAINLIEQSISEEANPLSSRLALAEARYIKDDLPGAAAELQRASALAPVDPALSLSMALVYSQLDDAVRATEEYLKAIQGIGMSAPASEGTGPVVLPQPYVPLPEGFNINRSIRNAHRDALSENEEDAAALALKSLAESASFVIAGAS